MALDMTPEQKAIGRANFNRAVGKLAGQEIGQGPTRRRFLQGMLAAGAAVPVAAAAYFGYSNERFRERPVKAGLIGAGDEGGVLVGEHNPEYLEFIAYSDIRPSNQRRIFEGEPTGPRKGFNRIYGREARRHIRLYENYHELLNNKDIEMVVIALPLHLHAQVAIDAMRAGKHVLCEKLMAWNIRQCKAMIRVADREKRILAVGHQRHYSLLYAHAVEVINSGILGEFRHIRALWHRNNARPKLNSQGQPEREWVSAGGDRWQAHVYRDGWHPDIKPEDVQALAGSIRQHGYRSMEELVRWRLYHRTGGGLMAELGSHQLDACSIFLAGGDREHPVHPIAVSATGGKYFYDDDREVEDHIFCTYEFPGPNYRPRQHPGNPLARRPDDVIVVTYSSISTNSFEPYGECIMGSQGTLVVEQEQSAMLFGTAGRSTEVTVTTSGGRPVLDASASSDAGERRAAAVGEAALSFGQISRGYREEMEHFAYCVRMFGQAQAARDEEEMERWRRAPRCDGRRAMGDAIMALTANKAMRLQQRIVFDPRWYDPQSPEVPDDPDDPARDVNGHEVQL
jgi:predicted dehydrogenase